MPKNFYFAYGYKAGSQTVSRLYRFIDGNFDRYDPIDGTWKPDPDQSRIFIGKDLEYEEFTEEQAKHLTVTI